MALPPLPAFPASRPRRLRRDAFTRALVREHHLHASDLILPVFVHDGHDRVQDVPSMPGVQRRVSITPLRHNLSAATPTASTEC